MKHSSASLLPLILLTLLAALTFWLERATQIRIDVPLPADKAGSFGRPVPGVEHRVVDAEDQGDAAAYAVLELALPLLEEAAGAPVAGAPHAGPARAVAVELDRERPDRNPTPGSSQQLPPAREHR